jgi:hypothetical protein
MSRLRRQAAAAAAAAIIVRGGDIPPLCNGEWPAGAAPAGKGRAARLAQIECPSEGPVAFIDQSNRANLRRSCDGSPG